MTSDIDDFDDDDDLDFEELNPEEVIKELGSFSSEKLCSIIVVYRYLGLYKEIYVPSMQELANRRINGDTFDFESYIEEQLNLMPKIEYNLNDLSGAIKQLKNR